MIITPQISAGLADQHVRMPATGYDARSLVEAPVALFGGLSDGGPERVGAFTYSWSTLPNRIASIGRYCCIAGDVHFAQQEHSPAWFSTSSFTYNPELWADWMNSRPTYERTPLPTDGKFGKITIGHDVWIGCNAYIRGGVTIGTGAIIGAHAVVTKDVPPYAIVVGNPGRIVRYRFDPGAVERLLSSEWWKYDFTDLGSVRVGPIDAALLDLDALTQVAPYEPEWISLDQPHLVEEHANMHEARPAYAARAG